MTGPKLLPRTETNARIAQEETALILRIQELRKMEYDWRMKLAKSEKEFNEMLAAKRIEWQQEYETQQRRMQELKSPKP